MDAPLFFTQLEAASVDRDRGVIRGVSVITSGVIAKGHNLEVDEQTLREMLVCCQAKGRVPVKENHKSGVEAVTGYLDGFRIEHDRLRADWTVLDAHPRRNQILETAERMPSGVGLSAAFLPPDKPAVVNGKKKARCVEMLSVDYVVQPAANPAGLFSAVVDNPQRDMSSPTAPKTEPTLADVLAGLNKINERLDAQEQRIAEIAEANTDPIEQLEQLAQMTDEELAEAGVTRAEVDEALAQVEAMMNEDGDNGEGEGDDAGAAKGADSGAGANAPAVTAALQSLQRSVVTLEAKLSAQEFAAERAQLDADFDEIERHVTELAAENDALRRTVELSKGSNVRPSVAKAIHFSAQSDNAYERKVVELQANPETAKQALYLARKAEPEGYADHLRAKGILPQ